MSNKTAQSSPRDFFLYFLNTIGLFTIVIAFITLVFQYINFSFPDPLNYYFGSLSGSIRWSTAILIVITPIFLILSWLIRKDLIKNPEKANLRVRRWLLSLTLSAAGGAMAVSLISIIYNYLGGELTTQFVLKVITIFIVATGVFGYYLWDIRHGDNKKSRIPKIALIKTIILVLAAIIAGFFIVGSPAKQRAQRFDELRINHLQSFESQIIEYWRIRNELPKNLAQISDVFPGIVIEVDPQTQKPYTYNTTGELSFELCADFATNTNNTKYARPYYQYGHNWDHGVGNKCFQTTIDPKLYPKDLGVKNAPFIR